MSRSRSDWRRTRRIHLISTFLDPTEPGSASKQKDSGLSLQELRQKLQLKRSQSLSSSESQEQERERESTDLPSKSSRHGRERKRK